LRADKFLSSAYQPVRYVASTDSDSPAEDLQQEIVQNNAIAGQIVGYAITNGGSGYTSTPTVNIIGNGTNARAYAVKSGEVIIDIKVVADSSGNSSASYFGKDYDYANVVITGGGGASCTARPIIGQRDGIGANPVIDLKSNGMMFNTKPEGIEGGDFVTGDEIFRQVSLVRNPRVDSANGTLLTSTTARVLDKMIFNSGAFLKSTVQKSTISGATSGATAILDDTNDSDTVWYHQNTTTGFTPFAVGETVSVVGNASITGVIAAKTQGEADPYSGDLLYIDNRSPVTRSTDQTEDLKIVITI
jgi:hypothetical protein